ncbi:peptidase M10 [Streptomyces ossamyceticus]|uniref:peptidase M10 n=1 Tax=Streptomyces ossamyceticus TaxID=249581 RepID=UPI00343C1535
MIDIGSGLASRPVGRSIAAFALVASLSVVAGSADTATAAADVCELTKEELTITDLPAGRSVIKCDAVGRVVTYEGTGVTVPEPGTAVTVDALSVDGESHGFTMEVDSNGIVSYDLSEADSADASTVGSDITDNATPPEGAPSEESDSVDADASDTGTGAELAEYDVTSSPSACNDGTYSTADRKEYGTYEWYVGDGGMPAGLSQENAKWAFWDAIDNITESYNNCGYSDQVGAEMNYRGPTAREANINSSNSCTSRDSMSTWDAGNLKDRTVALTCSWTWPMPGVKNDLREADVRFNTTENDFTNKPTSSCVGKIDLRSVATHEAGHVFGLKDLYGSDENLTMYGESFFCSTKARTLGKGDVLGLRSIY